MYKKFPCYYPGEFNPPTKFHMNTVEWLLAQPEIGHVYVVLGNEDNPEQLYQDKKAKLWEMMIKSSFSPNVSIIKSKDKHHVAEVFDILSSKRQIPCYVAVDEKTARNKEINEKFNEYGNQELQLIPSQFKKSSKQMLEAILENKPGVVKELLPKSFTNEAVDEYIKIIKKSEDPESPQERSSMINYHDAYLNKFNDGFWKSVFEPMAVNSPIKEELEEDYIPDGQVGNYKYNGLTPSVITSIATIIGKDKDSPDRSEYIKTIDKLYDQLVSKNPKLKDIETNIPDYRDVYFPKHDIVFGAISGIPPEDIKTYVEDSKGYGGVYLRDKGIPIKKDIQYVSKDTDDVLENNLLLELDFDLERAYRWKHIGHSKFVGEIVRDIYEFRSDENEYEVFFDSKGDKCERSFKRKGKGFYDMSKEGKAISIYATVMDITLDYIRRNKDINDLIISPINEKRFSLVKGFVDKNIPSGYISYEEKGDIHIVKNDSKNKTK